MVPCGVRLSEVGVWEIPKPQVTWLKFVSARSVTSFVTRLGGKERKGRERIELIECLKLMRFAINLGKPLQ